MLKVHGSMLTFFRADVLTGQSRKSTGVTNDINDASALFRCPSELACTISRPETEQSNGIQSSLILLLTPMLFLLHHVKLSLFNIPSSLTEADKVSHLM